MNIETNPIFEDFMNTPDNYNPVEPNQANTKPSNKPIPSEEEFNYLSDGYILDEPGTPTQNTWPSSPEAPTGTPRERTRADELRAKYPLKKKYSGFSFADACRNPKPRKWLIKNYIYEGRASELMYGESGCGKSFAIIDMACSIAAPEIESWQGIRSLKHGDVIYIAGEGGDGVRKRMSGFASENGINPDNVRLYVIDESFCLDSDTQEFDIGNTIANILDVTDKPELVIFDTVNRTMAGDENSAKDMSKYIRAGDKIGAELDCCVAYIHHSGKADKTSPRGSTALKAAMDIVLKVEKNGNIITLKQEKNKDGKLQKPLKFNAKEIPVPGWIDEDGEQETTLVLEINEELTQAEAIAKPKEKLVKIPESVKTAKETFAEAAEKYGEIIREGTDGTSDTELNNVPFVAVEVETWRKVFYPNSSADTQEGKKQAFRRARKTLREVGKILIIKEINGHEYYCLKTDYADETLSGASLEALIKERQEKEAPTERTGEIFDKEVAPEPRAMHNSTPDTPQTEQQKAES